VFFERVQSYLNRRSIFFRKFLLVIIVDHHREQGAHRAEFGRGQEVEEGVSLLAFLVEI